MTAMTELVAWEDLSELEQLEATYCDMHKDVYGVKARWYKAEGVEQARRDLELLGQALSQQMAEEAEQQKAAIAHFEQLVENTIKVGANDRETALRWIMQGSTANGDWEFICFEYGLPYRYFKKAA